MEENIKWKKKELSKIILKKNKIIKKLEAKKFRKYILDELKFKLRALGVRE